MSDRTRARLAAGLGITSMVLATSGCVSCGVGYVLAVPAGVLAFLFGRGVMMRQADEDLPETDTEAWGQVGAWTGLLGGGFSVLLVIMALVWLALWGLGITTAVTL